MYVYINVMYTCMYTCMVIDRIPGPGASPRRVPPLSVPGEHTRAAMRPALPPVPTLRALRPRLKHTYKYVTYAYVCVCAPTYAYVTYAYVCVCASPEASPSAKPPSWPTGNGYTEALLTCTRSPRACTALAIS